MLRASPWRRNRHRCIFTDVLYGFFVFAAHIDNRRHSPFLRLRKDLLSAGEAIQHDLETPEFQTAQQSRRDELGEVIAAFIRTFKQISHAINQRKQAEASLQESFSQAASYSKTLYRELYQGRAIKSSTGTMMRTAAVSAPAAARRISPACDALPSASSSPKACAVSHKKCDRSWATHAWYLTICA